eukprot:gene1569-4717_t
MVEDDKLDQKIEFVLKKRKKKDRDEIIKAKKMASRLRKRAKKKDKTRIKFVRAEKLVKSARREAADNVRLRAVIRNPRKIDEDTNNHKLILAIRLKSVEGVSARTRNMLRLLRLTNINRAVFLRATVPTLRMLKRVEPFVAYGYPTLKTVRDLIYKHGYGIVDGNTFPLTDNARIEECLGDKNIVCVEDIVHEIMEVGDSFQSVISFLRPVKLKRPADRWKVRGKQFVTKEEMGYCKEKINDIVERMC